MQYAVHTVETAPDAARQMLAAAQNAYGFLPNLLAVMAESPALVKAYTTLSKIFEETSLSPAERQVVLLTTSFENECGYRVAAHSAIAGMQKVPQDAIEAIRRGAPIAHKKLEALHRFTGALVASRGWPSEQDVTAFLAAGYTKAQILEVVLGVGLKTLSNYTNHVAETPLDAAFQPLAWTKAA